MGIYRHRWLLFVGILLLLPGCRDEDSLKVGSPSDPPRVTVVGYVTAIDDMTPVDGGVKIELRLDKGSTAFLLFGSLFTSPPPDEATLQLYEIVRRLEIEDHIRATGIETDLGIVIEELTVLEK
jgi:hypothetical protein